MSESADYADDNLSGENQHYTFRLFITGASTNSARAIANIKYICETHLAGRYSLEIIDVYQQKQLAASAQLVALPLLIKESPWPQRRFIGDLSDTHKLLIELGLIGS